MSHKGPEPCPKSCIARSRPDHERVPEPSLEAKAQRIRFLAKQVSESPSGSSMSKKQWEAALNHYH